MSVDVNNLGPYLAKLSDQQLKDYARLNKNNPYAFSLAVYEANNRKAVHNAKQAQQGMQPQPKVNEQELMAMAAPAAAPMPEDQGIARLSAGPMNFADGGIVAFADGGDVERYSDLGFTGWSYGDWATADKTRRQKMLDAERNRNMQQVISEGYRRSDPRALASVPSAAEQLGLTDTTATAADTDKAAPKVDTALRIPPNAPSAAAPSGFGALMKAVESPVSAGAQRSPYAADIEKLNAARVAQSEEEAKGIEALNAKFADAYKGKEERLSKREGELAGMKDQSLGLALLQAGAAMMSTPGSLGVAVGKGVEAGSRQYVAGMDKINAAKEKLADARDRLDDLKLNRDEMSAREILKAKSAINQQKNAGLELLLKADMEENKISRDEALKRLDMRTKIGIAQIQEQGATARANAPSANERIANLLGGGDVEKGLIRLTEIQAGKFNPQNAYAEYLSKRKEGDTVLSPVEFMTALRSISALQSGAPAPSGKPTGKVFE